MAATPSLSHLLFVSAATDLTADGAQTAPFESLYLHERATGTVTRLSQATLGDPDGHTRDASIDMSGQHIAFESAAGNLIANDTNNTSDIFALDRSSGQVTLLSTNMLGAPADGHSRGPRISGNGRHVLFESAATNLDLGSGINRLSFDLFVLDRDPDNNGVFDEAGTTQPVRIVLSSAGMVSSPAFYGYDLSLNGRFVVFATSHRGLTPDPVTAIYNLYFHDRDSDRNGVFDEPGNVETSLLSKTTGGIIFSEEVRYPTLSADGERVAFASLAPELNAFCVIPDGCNSFVMELGIGTVTTGLDPTKRDIIAAMSGRAPRLNKDGTFVSRRASPSGALLIRNVDTAQDYDACVSQFLRSGNRGCVDAFVSRTGQFTFFESGSSNLVVHDSNATSDVFLHDASALAPSSPPLTACEDLLDNDGNGLIDLDDPGCYAAEDTDEQPGETVRLAPVAEPARAPGAFTTLESGGLTGFNPDLAVGTNGVRHVAFETQRLLANESTPLAQVELARFDEVGLARATLGSGDRPRVAIDTQNNLHIVYRDALNGSLVYAGNDLQPIATLPTSCGTQGFAALALGPDQAPRVLTGDRCGNEVRLWRPGQPAITIGNAPSSTSTGLLDLAITPGGDSLALIANDDPDLASPELILLRLDSNDQLLSDMRAPAPAVPDDIAVRSDANGLAHVAYMPQGGNDASSTVLYLYEQAGSLVPLTFRLQRYAPVGYQVELFFAADGVTPRMLITRTNNFDDPEDAAPAHLLGVEDGAIIELTAPTVKGIAAQPSVATTAPGAIEFAYRELSNGNVLHIDPDAPPWRPTPVSTDPNNQLRDVALSNDGRRNSVASILTFTSPFPGGAGELALHRRDPATASWARQRVFGAIPQDAVALSPDGRSVAHFSNLTQELTVQREQSDGTYLSEPVISVSPFTSIDPVRLVGDDVIIGVLRPGDGSSADQVVAYQRDRISGQWTDFPLAGSPITAIVSMDAAMHRRSGNDEFVDVAYSNAMQGELRMARFDAFDRIWVEDSQVDDGGGTAVIGNTISIQLSRELARSGARDQKITTIAYDVGSRSRVRYAWRANAWQVWQPDTSPPAGALIRAVDHALINDSRQRPVLLLGLSNGEMHLLTRVDGEAENLLFQTESVAQDYDGDSQIRVQLNGRTLIGYGSATTQTTVSVGNPLGALPVAGESQRYSDDAATGGSDIGLLVGLCVQFIVDGFTVSKGAPLANPVPGAESVMDDWGTLFRRTQAGQRYVDFYTDNFPRMVRIVSTDHGLLRDGTATLKDFYPGIRAMVEGNGDQYVLTQQMMNNALDIWQRLADRDSGPLSAFIEGELAQWNNMQDFVDLTFDEWGTIIGLSVGAVGGADTLFADSFEN